MRCKPPLLPLSLLVAGALLLAAASPASAISTEPFISEYVEGSSDNKAIEIYNGTGAGLALGSYHLDVYADGSATATSSIDLTVGTLPPSAVHVVANSSASGPVTSAADQTSASLTFDGDDAVVLRKGGSTIVDAIGQIGTDPGTEWGSGDTSTQDNTLRRKRAVEAGDTDGTNAFDPAVEWDGFALDTFAGLGSHVPNTVTLGSGLPASSNASAGCTQTACTYLQTALPEHQLTAPFDGVVVRWRMRTTVAAAGPFSLRVVRPGLAGVFTGAGTGAPQSLAVGTNVFATRLPILTGDMIGFNNAPASGGSIGANVGSTAYAHWAPALADAATSAPTVTTPAFEWFINADVEVDPDSDGFGDVSQDNCAGVANAGQENNDGDAEGDVCDGDDDNDTVLDGPDNCPLTANADQANNDADAQGDVCDGDDDNDTVLDGGDNCPLAANADQANNDGDGQGDVCDGDDDNDGDVDGSDNCPLTANADQANNDADAQGDACDADDDNDGLPDASDPFPLDPAQPATPAIPSGTGGDTAGTLPGVLPSNVFSIARSAISSADGSVTLTVGLPGAGRFDAVLTARVASSSGRRRSRTITVARRTVNATAAGQVRLRLRPSSRAKSVLKRTGRLRVTAKLTYTPATGLPSSQTRALVLKLKKKKRR